MKYRKLSLVLGTAVALGAVTWGGRTLWAQQPGFKRVPLQTQPIAGYAGHDAVQVRGEFDPGAGAPKHTHPGEELGYILEGTVTFELEGKPPMTLKAGESFFIPAGHVHSAKNTGAGPAKVLSTYLVEKGKPLATPVPAAPAKK
jgi:quercetin dioxygenase-like cupin family protein